MEMFYVILSLSIFFKKKLIKKIKINALKFNNNFYFLEQ